MANSKLKEVLQELEFERNTILDQIFNFQHELDVIEEAIKGIRKIVNGQPATEDTGRKTNIQMVEDILRTSRKPMHILKIVEKMKEIRGTDVSRATIETAISRHLKTFEIDSKFQRLGDGMYEYQRTEQTISPANRDRILNIK